VVLENLAALDVGALIAIGGDDTLSYAARLGREGFPVVAIPKTMDNDVPGTEYCIGFSTAVTRAKELINRQRTTLGSHERIGVFRIFGRNAGYTAWYAAYVTSARCVIPEAPFDLDHLAQILADDRRLNPSGYSFVIASEGAIWRGGRLDEIGDADAYGHRRKADVGYALAEELRRRTGVETVHSDLTYDLRSGDPDALDQMVAITFANVAVDLLAEGKFGRMVAVRGGKYSHAPLPERSEGARQIDVAAMYNVDRFRPRYEAKLGSPLMLGPAVLE
jgi:6-phosphofructokinase 1